jgi:uncharacterized protein (DUF58 family)
VRAAELIGTVMTVLPPSPFPTPNLPIERRAVLERAERANHLAATIPPLQLAAQRAAHTVMQGEHLRYQSGPGEHFRQFRPYMDGDPSHRIDWRQSARGQRLYVRETEWSHAQTLFIWSDASPSMRWRSHPALPYKSERADLLALALAMLLWRAGERVGFPFSPLPVSSSPAMAERAALWLMQADRPSTLPPDRLPDPLALPPRARLILISDCLFAPDALAACLKACTTRHVRGAIAQVLDPAEETLPFEGRIRFEGLEGEGDVLMPQVGALRPAYQARLTAHRHALANLARAHGWPFITHRADHPPHTALLALWMGLSGQDHTHDGTGG